MRCEYCDQPVPRVIQRGDVVQNKGNGSAAVVFHMDNAGKWLSVAVIRPYPGECVTQIWQTQYVDLIHGTIHVTERL